MIELTNVTKHYGKGKARHDALKGVSLRIEAGEFVAITGTSGSGKTTLLNIIGGLDRDWKGSLTLAGQEMSAMSDGALSSLRNTHMGFVFQHFHLLSHLTCRENVVLPSFFADGAPKGDPAARAEELLRKVGLGEKVDAMPTALSGGQKQRVAIARALFAQPKVILCDEPTGSLDHATGLQILDLFQELNRSENITLIVVTHEAHIAALARRTIRLEDGALVEDIRRDQDGPADDAGDDEGDDDA